MKKIASAMFLLLFYFNISFGQNNIKIDGFFDDWNNNEYLYIRIKCDQEIDLTEQFIIPSKIIINIDSDNNPSTGYYTNNIGSEFGINFFDKLIWDDTNFPIVDTLSL